jgi:predicted ABC-type ATPase
MRLIFRTKSFPDPGHRGIPGHRGGSLPRNESASAPKETPKDKKKVEEPAYTTVRTPELSKQYNDIFKGSKVNPEGIDTMAVYKNPDGTWTKERQALHDKIIDSFFAGNTPIFRAGETPVSYILGGGPASGKSTLVKSGLVDLPKNMVFAAADDIKLMLPEFQLSMKIKDVDGAIYVHEESSYISKEIMKRSVAEGYNMLMDGTGDNNIESLSKKVVDMRTSGQPVIGLYVTCDTDIAISRSLSRAEKTGRYIPESVLRSNHKSVSMIFEDIVKAGIMDSISLYDTSSGKAIVIARAVKTKLEILDDKAYKRFLAKAKE